MASIGFRPRLIGASLSVLTASAIPIPKLDVADLVGRSDVVALGAVTSASPGRRVTIGEEGRQYTGQEKTVVLATEEYLKGAGPTTLAVHLTVPDDFIGYEDAPIGAHGMFFLRCQAATCVFTSPYYTWLRAARAPGRGDRPMARVASSFGNTLSAPDVVDADRLGAISALRTVPAADAAVYLRAGLSASSYEVQLEAAGALLADDDMSGLPLVKAALLGPPLTAVPDATLVNLRVSFRQAATNLMVLTAAADLLAASEVETRRTAAETLAVSESPAALPALVRALNDSDSEVRYRAVFGLGTITGDVSHAPTRSLFGSKESDFVNYWNAWARARGIIK